MTIEAVTSREDLAHYIDDVRRELSANPELWEHVSLEAYFEALAAYIREVPVFYEKAQIEMDPEAPSWQLFADLLAGAVVYE